MSEKIDSDTNQKNTESKSDKGSPMITNINGIKPNEHNNHTASKINKNTKPEKKLVSWFKRPTTEWILAIATVFIGAMAALQWQTLERTDQTSRLRDRAFVYFLNPTIIPYPPDKPIVWGIAINMENAGNMPARRISIRYAWTYSQKSENLVDPFPLAKWSDAQVPNVMGPKQHFFLQAGEIPIKIIEEAKKSIIDVFILMEAKYIDGFELDKYRVTQMSRSLRFDAHGGQSLGFAGPHNCTDDDCN